MNQSISTSPPWWDGTIAINFSVEEWKAIFQELAMLYEIPGFPENEKDDMIVHIMNRIEKETQTYG
jgi:hypothetical protein